MKPVTITPESWDAANRVLQQVQIRADYEEIFGEGWGARIAAKQDKEDDHRLRLARLRARSQRVQDTTIFFLALSAAACVGWFFWRGVVAVFW